MYPSSSAANNEASGDSRMGGEGYYYKSNSHSYRNGSAHPPPSPPVAHERYYSPPQAFHGDGVYSGSPYDGRQQQPGQASPTGILGPRRNSGVLVRAQESPINVTCRIRGHTPLTPSQAEMQVDPDAHYRHQYGFSYYDHETPSTSYTPTRLTPGWTGFMVGDRQTPVINSTSGSYGNMYPPPQGQTMSPSANGFSVTSMPMELPSEVVHQALAGRCRFIAFPEVLPPTAGSASSASPGAKPPGTPSGNGVIGSTGTTGSGSFSGVGHSPAANTNTNSNNLAVFIGQVRFETTPAELIWLVQRTCGACATHLEGRGAGCYLLFCRSEADLQLVRTLHKRILFDIGGVWFARTADEIDALCEYVALDAPLLSKRAHLPRDSMVVEELKVDLNPRHAASPNPRPNAQNGNPNGRLAATKEAASNPKQGQRVRLLPQFAPPEYPPTGLNMSAMQQDTGMTTVPSTVAPPPPMTLQPQYGEGITHYPIGAPPGSQPAPEDLGITPFPLGAPPSSLPPQEDFNSFEPPQQYYPSRQRTAAANPRGKPY